MGTTTQFTPEAGIKMIHRNLEEWGFAPRDSDGSDFQRGANRDLRFKVGGSMGEVTVQVVKQGQATLAIRATSWAGIDRVLFNMAGCIEGLK